MKPLASKKLLRVERAARTTGSRAAILRAAEHIFAEEGLAGARTDAIAAAAGVNKALLYYYFKSKDDLYVAILEGHMKDFHEQALHILSDDEGPAGPTLLRYISMHFDFMSARPEYPRLVQRFMMAHGRPFERLARKYSRPVSARFREVIERGMRSGEFRASDTYHTVISLAALTSYYFAAAPVLRILGQTDPYDEAQLARRKEEVLSFVRHALFQNPEACLP